MASKPATTVTLKHLAASVAEDNELSKKQAEAILGGLVGQIVKHLKKGERIRIGGLGILQVRKRAARMGRNPATGEAIQIKASKTDCAMGRRSARRPRRSVEQRTGRQRLFGDDPGVARESSASERSEASHANGARRRSGARERV